MTSIVINGAAGTMGKVVAALAAKDPETYTIVAGVDQRPGEGETGFPIYTSFDNIQEDFDAIIDFSLPAALPNVLAAAKAHKCGAVIATTGLSQDDYKMILEASQVTPVFRSANMSLGVNLQMELVKRASSFLGEQFDIEIVEKHHNQKIDAPSGTALALAEVISDQFVGGKEFVFDRSEKKHKRNKRELGISAVRGGTIVGEHEVFFIGEDEVVEISHVAHSKRIFAVGALRAAAFLKGQKPRLYSMAEVIAVDNRVTGLSATPGQSIITIENFAYTPQSFAALFTALADSDINIDMINQSLPIDGNVHISFTLPQKHLADAVSSLEKLGYSQMRRLESVTKYCIEGDGMEYLSGVAAEVFRLLAQENIESYLITTSETKISFCLEDNKVEKLSAAVAKAFNL